MASGAVGALAVDPADPLHLVAVLDGALTTSSDGGKTFDTLNLPYGELK